jgi:hypothetical protein
MYVYMCACSWLVLVDGAICSMFDVGVTVTVMITFTLTLPSVFMFDVHVHMILGISCPSDSIIPQ